MEEELENSQRSENENESMETFKKNDILGKVLFFGLAAVLICYVVFFKGGDEKVNIDSLTIESIETVNEDVAPSRRLIKPEIPQNKSMRDKLAEKRIRESGAAQGLSEEEIRNKIQAEFDIKLAKEKTSLSNKLKSARKREEKLRARSLLENARNQEQLAKSAAEHAERMNNRRRSSMSGASSGGRGSSQSSKNSRDEQRSKLYEQKSVALDLQKKLLSGKLNGMGQGGGGLSRGRPIKTRNSGEFNLMELPESTATTVTATVLKDKEWLITEGTTIQATLETAVNSNLSGTVRAITQSPVYSFTGNLKIIPESSELIGEYSSASSGGEPRIFIMWTRLITPDGISINLDSPGIDQLGRSGLAGQVNTHFFKRFGSSMLISILGGIAQVEASNPAQVEAFSSNFNKAAEIALEHTVDLPPTVARGQGARIGVFVKRDLNFKTAMMSVRPERLAPFERKEKHGISYDRVFDTRDLSHHERAMLANRFIADREQINAESFIKRPFSAKEGQSLRATLQRWAEKADYVFFWEVEDTDGNTLDWNLPTDIVMHGNLHDVVQRIISSYKKSGVNLSHQFFGENDVLVVRLNNSDDDV